MQEVSQKINLQNQKLELEEGTHSFTSLDAQLIDVYKHCHAAILVFDSTKQWTFDYVKREVKKIPKDIQICVLVR